VRRCSARCSAHLPVTMATAPLDTAAANSTDDWFQSHTSATDATDVMSADSINGCRRRKLPERRNTRSNIAARDLRVNGRRQISPAILNSGGVYISACRKFFASITVAGRPPGITCVLIAVSRLRDTTLVGLLGTPQRTVCDVCMATETTWCRQLFPDTASNLCAVI